MVGSQISGTRVLLQSGRDTTLTAATVLADRDISVDAGRHLSILAAQQSQQSDSSSQRSGTSIGLMPGLSARFTLFGQNAAAQDGSQHASESVTSALSATGGNLSLKAGTAGAGAAGSGTVTVQGADLLAQDRVSIRGTEVDLQAVANKSAAQSHTQSKATTVGAALTGTVGSLLTKISDQIETARHTDDDRLQAAAALKAGYDAYKLGSALASEGGAANLAEGVNSGAAIGISVSVGVSQSRSDSQQSESQVRGTNIQAGSIDIRATQGDLSAQAAKLQAQDISLEAKQNILLTAGANQSDIKSSNKSSSVGGGVTLGMGEQSGLSFQLSASQAKGRVNGSETLYDNSQVIASDSLSLKSGRDTTLQGAQLGGDKVTMNVGGDLTIQTQQDQSLYDSKQSSAGFSLSVCVPPICAGTFVTGSLNIAKQTISQNYLSAVGQSGITAGSQGFDISVAGNTDLQGAGITSKADKDKNYFQTGSLTSSDLANHQNTSSSSMSVGLAYTGASTGATLAANAASNVLGNALGQSGLPQDKNEQSQTLSVISPAQITITSGDAASQKTAAKLTSRDASTANQSLTNTFSLQQAQAVEAEAKEQQARQQAAQLVGAVVTNVIGDVAAAKYKESGGTAWGEGSPEKIALHGMAGLIQAKIGGTDAAAGIAAGMAHEALAPAMSAYLEANGYSAKERAADLTGQKDKDFKELMEAGSKLLGAAVGAAVGDSAKNAAAGSQIALVADQNNRQLHPSERQRAKELAAKSGGKYTQKQIEDAMRNSGNSAQGENITAGMLVDPSKPEQIYDKGAAFTTYGGGTLVQVNPDGKALGPSNIDPDLAAFVRANTGGTASPYYDLAPSVPSAPSGPAASNGLRYERLIANGQTFTVPVADCPAVSCRNSDNIARYGLSKEDLAQVQAYDDAVKKQSLKEVSTAAIAAVAVVATPVTLTGMAVAGAVTGGTISAKDQLIDKGTVDGTVVAKEAAKGAVLSVVGYGVATTLVPGLKVVGSAADDLVTGGAISRAEADAAAATAAAKISNNAGRDGDSFHLESWFKLKEQTDQVRKQLPDMVDPASGKPLGNAAVAEINVNGQPSSTVQAHSRIGNSAEGQREGFVSLPPEGERILKPLTNPRDTIPREVDTEYKILENFAQQHQGRAQVQGHINLFTERPPCDSCTDVIKNQFTKLHPSMELRVYHNNGEITVYKGDSVSTVRPSPQNPPQNPGDFPRAPGLELPPGKPKKGS